jgi:hypothetical protein
MMTRGLLVEEDGKTLVVAQIKKVTRRQRTNDLA